jgi:hypothetical protein
MIEAKETQPPEISSRTEMDENGTIEKRVEDADKEGERRGQQDLFQEVAERQVAESHQNNGVDDKGKQCRQLVLVERDDADDEEQRGEQFDPWVESMDRRILIRKGVQVSEVKQGRPGFLHDSPAYRFCWDFLSPRPISPARSRVIAAPSRPERDFPALTSGHSSALPLPASAAAPPSPDGAALLALARPETVIRQEGGLFLQPGSQRVGTLVGGFQRFLAAGVEHRPLETIRVG